MRVATPSMRVRPYVSPNAKNAFTAEVRSRHTAMHGPAMNTPYPMVGRNTSPPMGYGSSSCPASQPTWCAGQTSVMVPSSFSSSSSSRPQAGQRHRSPSRMGRASSMERRGCSGIQTRSLWMSM